ncbi:AAA family ATPase [Thalassoglobus sp.]|uniref:AAA family ATPase n=1 Tax=Thalassoglobus sp. TaxID=2795869 RepID=UPI003AA7C6CD
MQPGTLTDIDNLLMSLGNGEDMEVEPKSASPMTSEEAQESPSASTENTDENPAPSEDSKETVAKEKTHAEKIEEARRLPKVSDAVAKLTGETSIRRLSMNNGVFIPPSPDSLSDAGLSLSEVMNLILKYLYNRGVETGYKTALQIGLKFPLVEGILRQLKIERLAAYKNSIAGGDYLYELTDLGRDRARTLAVQSTYFGTAPVPLDQYIESVNAQSLAGRKPTLKAIRRAFADLDISDRMISNIGQAIHSGRGMFLYGAPGNGKTSMAERVTKSFGDTIWIPRSIVASGEIIRLYDPNRHRPIKAEGDYEQEVDGRWVQIERPTIVSGGELTMEDLEITYIRKTGVGEAPLQLKSNCGTLLIDDFGRQRMSTDELLNRWIVPLEQRIDFLHMESGRTIQVPFDQLIIFSSNLEPRDLVDDAFLRRIPYKIEVKDASEIEFRNLFIKMAKKARFECSHETVDYLIQHHYVGANRPFRFCHPRDLLRQVENRCTLHNLPHEITKSAIDQAVENYFSIM